jgi:PAS domain S-box-containing protein
MPAPLPENEQLRINALLEYRILDTEAEDSLDELTKLAATICDVPLALITLVDNDRSWVKSDSGGLGMPAAPRDSAFCSFTILNPNEICLVEDAMKDNRFVANPFVTGEPNIRFYAGAPLVTGDGLALGSLCVIDYKPRVLGEQQLASLKLLANQVMSQFELRRTLQNNEILSNRYQQILTQSPEGICLFDFEGKIISVNQKFCQLTARTETELLNLHMQDLHSPEDLRLRPIPFDKLHTGVTLIYERHLQRPDGTIITIEKSAKMIDKDTVQAVIRNITQRKRMEAELKRAHDAALESSRLKSSFLTNVSHEIRTPMNGIIGMIELLLRTPLDRIQRDYAETVRQSADSLLTIINEILDLAKIESGKLRFETIDFDLRREVETTVELLAERAFQKNIEIASFIEADVPLIVRGDPGRLRQVLLNLISNAVKFTENGEIAVTVKTEKNDKNSILLRFTVTDTGIGIPQESLKNLFQPFVQVDNSTARQFGGTGLGLAICKQIVEMMNGEITVETQLHKGSQFSFTASFPEVSDNQETVTSKLLLDGNSDLLNGKRILIADQSSIVRQTLKKYCLDWKMVPSDVTTGDEVLRELRVAVEDRKPFDAVILNMNLPDWEGFSLTQGIKMDDVLSPTEIILITSYGRPGDGKIAEKIGAACYFTKPVCGSHLLECLASTLKKNQSFAEKLSLITRHSLREVALQTGNAPIFNQKDFRLLVVEDNEVNRRVLTKQLEEIGIHPDIAKNGIEALEKIERSDYQLVLMDCQMPRLDGYQTTGEIRRREHEKLLRGEKFLPLPIIALTAHTFDGEREKCLAAGMNDYLSKPVRINELFDAIQVWSQPPEPSGGSDQKLSISESIKPDSKLEARASKADFDAASLQTLENSSDKDFVREILDLYVADTEKYFEEIKHAAEDKDWASVMRIAHAVRGNSLAVGVNSVAAVMEQIEEIGKHNSFSEIKNLLSKFAEEFARFKKALNKDEG